MWNAMGSISTKKGWVIGFVPFSLREKGWA